MKVVWKEDSTNRIKRVSAGFSWTVFFLSFLVPLWRRHWSWAGLLIVAEVFIYVVIEVATPNVSTSLDSNNEFVHVRQEELLTYFVLTICYLAITAYISAIYNRNYGKHLIDKGWKVVGVDGGTHSSLEGKWNMEIPKADTTTLVTEIKMK